MEKRKKLVITLIFGAITLAAIFTFLSNKAFFRRNEEEEKENRLITKVIEVIKQEATHTDEKGLEGALRAIYRVSKKKGIDYRMILALARVESNFRDDAVSPKGARGLLQLKPSIAESVARDIGIPLNGKKCLHDSEKNVTIGIHLLLTLIDEYYDIHAALSAYNMGKAKIQELSANQYRTKFSNAVLREYKRYMEILPDP